MSDEKTPDDDVVFVSGKTPISRALAEELSVNSDLRRALEQEIFEGLVRSLSDDLYGRMMTGGGAPRAE